MIPKLNIHFPPGNVISSLAFIASGKKYDYSEGNLFFLNHARTGIRVALSVLKLTPGTKVGMSLYNCVSVMNAIIKAGCSIEFIDVTDDLTLDLDDLRRKKDSIGVLVVSHLFGLPNDIDKIRKICPGIPVIEDCAHAMGSHFEDGTEVGSKGDISVFSLGQGKFPSIGEGGILRVNNHDYYDPVSDTVKALPRPSSIGECGMVIKSFIKHILYFPAVYNHIASRRESRNMSDPVKDDYRMTESLMPGYVRHLWESEKKKISGYTFTQRANFRILSRFFSESVQQVKIPLCKEEQINGFMFPFLLTDSSECMIVSHLSGLEVATHFYRCVKWAEHFGYDGGCPNAEKIASRLRVVPCHYNLNLEKCFHSRN